MASLAAVIFDLDDTLFDHRGAATSGVPAWLADIGVEPSDELVSLWFAAEQRHLVAWHRGEITFAEQRRQRLREILPQIGRTAHDDAELDQMFADYLVHYEAAWRRFDDVETALEIVASAGLSSAVLTNGAEHQQTYKIEAIGLSDKVGRVFCCDQLGFAKPDQRAYQQVCRSLGITCDQALHVGDRYDLDVVAARAAGLHAVFLDRENRGPYDEPERITSLTQLDGLLDRLKGEPLSSRPFAD